MSNKTAGQVAFEAYNQARGGVTFDGRPIPAWDDLHGDKAAIQAAWEAAATAVIDETLIRLDHRPDELIKRARDAVRAFRMTSREQALTLTKLDEATMWHALIPMGQ